MAGQGTRFLSSPRGTDFDPAFGETGSWPAAEAMRCRIANLRGTGRLSRGGSFARKEGQPPVAVRAVRQGAPPRDGTGGLFATIGGVVALSDCFGFRKCRPVQAPVFLRAPLQS